MKTERFKLGNLCCVSCADEVERALRANPNVVAARVHYREDEATVSYEEGAIGSQEVARLIESAGHGCSRVVAGRADGAEHEHHVTAAAERPEVGADAGHEAHEMHAMHGAGHGDGRQRLAHIEHQTQMAPISMGTKMDRMQYEMPATAAAHVHEQVRHEAMEHAGMDHDMSDPKMARAMEADMRTRFWVALALTIPTVLYSPLFTEFFGVRLPAPVDPNLIMFAFSTPVVWWSGWVFIAGAYHSLRRRALNMSVLIATGVLAAYLFSLVILFTGGESFFEAAGMLVTFVLFGHWMEMRARRGTNEALRALFDLVPPTAQVIRDGKEVTIPTSEIVQGDIVLLRPGDKAPVDGEVVEGDTTIDEALVTGESMPVRKGPGDAVIGGSINQAGSVRFRATKVGSDTVLAQIAALVAEAQNSKAPSQRLADVAAQYLVILAVGSGLITFFAWRFIGNADLLFALTFAISAVVIACPDALGLATPTAVAVGTGLGAKHNILIKDAATLEGISRVNTVVFDKTGTLTQGAPSVTDVVAASGWSGDEILRLEAGAEALSGHPISRAILAEAAKRGISTPTDVRGFEALAGRGVRAVVEGRELLVGTVRLMEEEITNYELRITNYEAAEGKHGGLPLLRGEIDRLLSEGKTISILAVDGKIAGVVAVADPVKPSARRAIEELKERGVEAVMITGDNRGTASAVASQLGIERFFAEVLPADKANHVKQLQSEGRVVAMVGDGINDAPALAQADTGIAIGAGTDVAIQTADVVLMKSDPLDVLRAIKLSGATVTKMKQNLFWASIYNVLAIPVAAGVLYPSLGLAIRPEFSALLMSASSIIVATNAVLLKRAEKELR